MEKSVSENLAMSATANPLLDPNSPERKAQDRAGDMADFFRDEPHRATQSYGAMVQCLADEFLEADATRAMLSLAQEQVTDLRNRKNAAYAERNRCVALIARMALAMGLRVGVKRTAIEGWSDDWNGCVYIDLPTGQVSWHFHDSQAAWFEALPDYDGDWDGHDTDEKYARVMAAFQKDSA